jgi:hypothetical protein
MPGLMFERVCPFVILAPCPSSTGGLRKSTGLILQRGLAIIHASLPFGARLVDENKSNGACGLVCYLLHFRQFCLSAIYGGFWKTKTPYMVVVFLKISHKP